jgi:hypothetical protein
MSANNNKKELHLREFAINSIKLAFENEINNDDNIELLLRDNSLATKMWSGFIKIECKIYFYKIVYPPLKKILKKTNKIESVDKNKTNMLNYTIQSIHSLIFSIINSIDKVPLSIKKICEHIYICLLNKYNDPIIALRGISSTFFLRFICPSLLYSKNLFDVYLFDLNNPIDSKYCSFSNILITAVKTIQNIVNFLLYNEEDNMFLNLYINEISPLFINFMEDLANVSENKKLYNFIGNFESKYEFISRLFKHRSGKTRNIIQDSALYSTVKLTASNNVTLDESIIANEQQDIDLLYNKSNVSNFSNISDASNVVNTSNISNISNISNVPKSTNESELSDLSEISDNTDSSELSELSALVDEPNNVNNSDYIKLSTTLNELNYKQLIDMDKINFLHKSPKNWTRIDIIN